MIRFYYLFLVCLVVESALAADVSSEEVKTQVKASLAKVNVNEQTTLFDLLPEAKEMKNKSDLSDCYSPTYAGVNVDMYTKPISEIVHHYFSVEKQFVSTDLDKRTKALVDNMVQLNTIIKNCLDRPKNQRNQFGITSMSAYSHDEFRKIAGGVRLPDKP